MKILQNFWQNVSIICTKRYLYFFKNFVRFLHTSSQKFVQNSFIISTIYINHFKLLGRFFTIFFELIQNFRLNFYENFPKFCEFNQKKSQKMYTKSFRNIHFKNILKVCIVIFPGNVCLRNLSKNHQKCPCFSKMFLKIFLIIFQILSTFLQKFPTTSLKFSYNFSKNFQKYTYSLKYL